MCGHVGQPTNYSLMNEVYETERIVSKKSEVSWQHPNIAIFSVVSVDVVTAQWTAGFPVENVRK